MKIHDLHILHTALEARVRVMETEIESSRLFKHATNGTLHAHNAKIDVITNQQNHAAEGIERLTKIVEDGMKKISQMVNVKFMIIGAAGGCSFIAGIVFIILKLYLDHFYGQAG